MLRILGFALVLPLLLLLVGAAHVYLLQRLVLDFAPPALIASIGTGLVACFAVLIVASPIGERVLPPRLHRFIAWPASIWMGFGFFALLPLLLLEIGFAALGIANEPGSVALRWRSAGVLCGALLLAAVALRGGLRPPQLRDVTFEIERWPRALDGYRIVQITDIHIGPLLDRRFAAALVARVNALAPDLVAVTGDLVDGPLRHLAPEVAPFAGLRSRDGVYFVTGNHDHLSHAPTWVPHVETLGMRVLRNERVEIGEGEESFDLVGVDDYAARFLGGGRQDVDAALAGRDPERAGVLLAHDPNTFRHARHCPIDLQISGHTHGGQIWPFAAFVRLAVPWVSGSHREGRAQLYVSRGTGFWGPPMRLLAPAEITQIEIRTKRECNS